MVIRLSKTGRFLACSGFPKCRNKRALDEEGEPVAVEQVGENCPDCGEPLIVKTGKRGRFVGCSGYPKCKFTRPLEGDAAAGAPKAPAEPTGEACPKCGKPLLTRVGRRGKFVGCSGYPRCRFTRDIPGEGPPAPEATGQACEKCGAPMVLRTWRRRRFLACSGYPKCRNMKPYTSGEPTPPPQETGRVCPECGKPLLVRTSARGPFIGCSGYPKCRHTENATEGAAGADEPKAPAEEPENP
jgi:DNA topoisomerase-1